MADKTQPDDPDEAKREFEEGLKLLMRGGSGRRIFEHFQRAAIGGYAPAQYQLGVCYDGGIGAKRDEVQAVKWFRAAAMQGMPRAQAALGEILYFGGQSVRRDRNQGMAWLEAAAESNVFEALGMLGQIHADARSSRHDLKTAVVYFMRAAECDLSGMSSGLPWLFNTGLRKNEARADIQVMIDLYSFHVVGRHRLVSGKNGAPEIYWN